MARLQDLYKNEIVSKLMKDFEYGNVMQVPKVSKVTLNMGVGEGASNMKTLDSASENMTNVAGQHAVITRAKRSIAAFKLREGMPIGCRVTLRHEKMYEFLDRLLNVALPRVRDFRGLSLKAFDGRGNYTIGIRDQLIFPEIDYNSVDVTRGMNITIVTTAKTDEEARKLLSYLGVPFRKN
ncbi:MAG: 50S ribosomal protein L5 [Acidobacteria bacterium]|nr:MAG: 50S ribosomal protein L5 [Acidobacteriota bacterium]RLE22065.1 MAG: 50S ribosomal protein L5 [Acidobacteriota bacterium]